MVKQSFKLFTKTRYLLWAFLLFGIYLLINISLVLYRMLFVVDNPSISSLLYKTNEMSIFYFILFLLLSYELNGILKKNHVEESLEIYSKPKGYISNLKMLLIVDAVFTFIIWFINVLGVCVLNRIHIRYVGNITINIFLYYFLSAMVAILLGIIIAYVFRKKIAYIMIALIMILVSPVMDILNSLFGENADFYRIKWYFSFLPQGYALIEDAYLGYAVQIQKIALVLFWLALCVFILQILFQTKKKYLFSIMGILVTFLGCMIPGQKLTASYQLDNWVSYADIYYRQNELEEVEPRSEFYVKKYDIDFWTVNQLYGKVEMDMEQTGLPEYHFTLYHTYQVKNVENQNGSKLPFTQDGDLLTVLSEGETVSKIIVEYSGTGNPFYSEFCGTFLKSGIAFYPIANFQKQYENGKFADVVSGNTDFQVRVHSLKKFYCTLETNGKNNFSGKANGFTLIDGALSVDKVGDVTFVYPVIQSFSAPIEEIERNFISQMDKCREEKQIQYSVHNKTIILGVSMNAAPIASFFDNHMVVSGFQFDYLVKEKYLQEFVQKGGENL